MRILVLFLISLTLVAQSPKPKLPGEDWVPLFNGKDLGGWIKIGNEQWDVVGRTIDNALLVCRLSHDFILKDWRVAGLYD